MLPMIVDLEKIALEYNDVNDWVQKNPDIMANAVYEALERIASGEKDIITLIELCIEGECEYEIQINPKEADEPARHNEAYWASKEDFFKAARVRDIRKEYIQKKNP
jgi:hypothetical protein